MDSITKLWEQLQKDKKTGRYGGVIAVSSKIADRVDSKAEVEEQETD